MIHVAIREEFVSHSIPEHHHIVIGSKSSVAFYVALHLGDRAGRLTTDIRVNGKDNLCEGHLKKISDYQLVGSQSAAFFKTRAGFKVKESIIPLKSQRGQVIWGASLEKTHTYL